MSEPMQKKIKGSPSNELEINKTTSNKTEGSPSSEPEIAKAAPIPKPDGGSNLEKFKSKRAPTIPNVATLQTALPHYKIADAEDFVRLHPGMDYWSDEFCFVNVPIKGEKRETLHLIDEEIAMQYLPSKRIQRFRLALATKPYDVFFLCHIPTRNLDNKFNETSLLGCEQAKTLWVQVTSRKSEGVDEYKINPSHDLDAFPKPEWPKQTLYELIEITFAGRMIDRVDHPALLRLIGAKQSLK
jgi:hypothetical protein